MECTEGVGVYDSVEEWENGVFGDGVGLVGHD